MAAAIGFPGFVNLTDTDFLAERCLDPSFDLKVDAQPLEQMFKIAQRMYESAPQLIANASFSYSTNPELLVSLVSKVRGGSFFRNSSRFWI